MRIELVRNPIDIYRSKIATGIGDNTIRIRTRYRDAEDRFNSRFRVGYGGTILPLSNSQGFKGYHLGNHDLLYIRAYERNGEINRIIKDRVGEHYLLGIELEIEKVSDRDAVGDILKRYLPDRHICVRDGSIASDGIEIVTSPLAPREIGRVPWYRLLRSLSRSGCTSHDSGNCGLHVSISRSALNDRTWRSLRSMLSRDRALFETLSRRTIGKGNKNGDPFHFCSFSPRESKYQALNLSKSAVCEFRFFRGTLAPLSFIASIEIVRSLVDYARDRESGSDSNKAPRLTAKGWIAWIKNRRCYGVAWEYMKDHAATYLETPRAPRAPRGPRLPRGSRVARFVAERFGHLDITVEGGLVGGRSILGRVCVTGLRASTTEHTYQIPILWDRSLRDYHFPQYVRDAVRNGNAPTHITVRSSLVAEMGSESPIHGRGVVLAFYRGGWGNRSQGYYLGSNL